MLPSWELTFLLSEEDSNSFATVGKQPSHNLKVERLSMDVPLDEVY